MSFYSDFAGLAKSMLSEFGEVAAIRRTATTGGGPSDASGGTEVDSDYVCRLAAFPVSQADVLGGLAKAGDFRVIVSAVDLSITPVTTDKVISSHGTLVIVDAGKFAPAGTTTHYKMIARRP